MKNQIVRTWKRIFNSKSGMTLVELIVVFALMGIFMVAATFMLTTSIQLFNRIQATSQAVTVSDLILDKISGEIAAADIPKMGMEGYYFWLENDDDSSWVAFSNRSGSPVSIYADDDGDFTNGAGTGKKQLYIKYYKMSEIDEKQLNEVNWHFDDRVYMKYRIEKLRFSRPKPSLHPNVVKIDLTLINEQTGFAYSSVRYAENYNFDFKSNYMCVRSDGNLGFPNEADEFKIRKISGENPDKPEIPEGPEQITYYIHFQDKEGNKIRETESRKDILGRRIEITEDMALVPGTTKIPPPSIPGYVYDPTSPNNYIENLDNLKNNIFLEYKPIQAGGSITVTDSKGTKHTLYPNLNWEEVKKTAVANNGYNFNVSDMLCDDTGFYIVINAPYVGADVAGKTLEQVANEKGNFLKITEATKLFIKSDLVHNTVSGEMRWPENNRPQRGELAYFNENYFITQNETIRDIPPNGVWIKLPVN